MFNEKKTIQCVQDCFWTTLKSSLWSLQLRLSICITRWSIIVLKPIIAVTFWWSLILFNSSLLSTYSLHLLEVFEIFYFCDYFLLYHIYSFLTFSATVFLSIFFFFLASWLKWNIFTKNTSLVFKRLLYENKHLTKSKRIIFD